MNTPFQRWLAQSNWATANPDSVDRAREAWNQAVADTAAVFWQSDAVRRRLSPHEMILITDMMHTLKERPLTK